MAVEIHVTIETTGTADVHELRRFLTAQPRLRGRVTRADASAPPPPGTMGLVADALLALLAPGGVASVLAGAVIAWVQSRKGDQSVTLTRPDGTQISVTSTQVRSMDPTQVEALVRQLAAQLEPAEGDAVAGPERQQPDSGAGGTLDPAHRPAAAPADPARRPGAGPDGGAPAP
ncbi:hypothetical protein [Streptomyces sp. S.PNR 29]|uniref:effector-associated constant component EACC1 n=1 Tax=Streptomyces sp. S.PNR 29 TaxID=2973805 RepID=UPI0025AF9D41|nr:hypothetical protein [Streptomyces sp. S.PNR 29]MDN0200572.1 hypothetical protein [Streptomyces sp. S.PNR 29]